MNVWDIHAALVKDYAIYISSFINISDDTIASVVRAALAEGKLCPQPLLQFNPTYEMAGSILEIVRSIVDDNAER